MKEEGPRKSPFGQNGMKLSLQLRNGILVEEGKVEIKERVPILQR